MVDLFDLVDTASRLTEDCQDTDFNKNFKLLVAQYQSWCGNNEDRPAPTRQYLTQVQDIIGVPNPNEFSADKDLKILRSIFYLTGKKLNFQGILNRAEAISSEHKYTGATAACMTRFGAAATFAEQCLDENNNVDFQPDHCLEGDEVSTYEEIARKYKKEAERQCSEIEKILLHYQSNLAPWVDRPQIYNVKHTIAKLKKVNYLMDSFHGQASDQDKLITFRTRLAEENTIKTLTQTRDTATSRFFKGLATLCILPALVLAALSKRKTGTYNYFKGSSGDKTIQDIKEINDPDDTPSVKGGG